MSTGLTALGDITKAAGSYEAGQTRSKLLEANAGIAGMQSGSEAAAGNYNAMLIRRRGQQILGQQTAAFGANNLQQRGTPTDVAASTAQTTELDALTTRNNALRRAWGFQIQGASDVLQSDLARVAGVQSAEGTILGGSADVYKQYKQVGWGT